MRSGVFDCLRVINQGEADHEDWKVISRDLAIVGAIAAPMPAHAQEATLSGTITDATGGVLPGVTVTVVHWEPATRSFGVTDEAGAFRLPVRVGDYRVSAELSGFATVDAHASRCSSGRRRS